MYKLEKPRNKEERFRADYSNNNPSFSSTLLDEIYRSIDVGSAKSPGHLKFYRDNKTKKHAAEKPPMLSRTRCNAVAHINMDDQKQRRRHDFVEFERKFLLLQQQRKHDPDFDQDLLFFSSTSNSSDSSSGGFSSSDTDSIYASRSTCSSLPPPTMPKPVKTSAESRARARFYDHSYGKDEGMSDTVSKSKLRALKIYSKVKQPISPGGKISNFINSLFTAGTPKKKKSKDLSQASSCSSASSLSRSCLSKNSPTTREKLRNGEKRTVRFYPVSVIVDEDNRPCGQKRLISQEQQWSVQSTTKTPSSVGGEWDSDMMKRRVMEKKSHKVEEIAIRDFRKEYHGIEMKQHVNFEEQGMEDDVSCSSSDLFELDHNAVIERDDVIFSSSEELPVFETTSFHSIRHIANRALTIM